VPSPDVLSWEDRVMRVEGLVAPGFEPVVEAVAGCGPGVSVAAFVRGRRVVDVWTEDLAANSLLCTWSAVKPVTGACLLLLVERGAVALDDPVTWVWPELGDDRLLVRHLLSHTAGRVTVPDVPLTDWDRSIAALASMAPDWPPGMVLCEHAQTFGHLIGEVVRRVDGRSLGRFLADEITAPLRLDLHVGLGDDDLPRVADTVGLDPVWWAAARGTPGSVRSRAMGPWCDVNERIWRQAELPAVNGHATARALAGFWQAFLDFRLPHGVDRPEASGYDLFVADEVTWTLAGGRVDGPDIGMGGLGGQWAAARPALHLAWAFLTTHVGDDQRAQRVEHALVRALATPPAP
jgi:CubicO group peptidase (beta-lactamase class C family)